MVERKSRVSQRGRKSRVSQRRRKSRSNRRTMYRKRTNRMNNKRRKMSKRRKNKRGGAFERWEDAPIVSSEAHGPGFVDLDALAAQVAAADPISGRGRGARLQAMAAAAATQLPLPSPAPGTTQERVDRPGSMTISMPRPSPI